MLTLIRELGGGSLFAQQSLGRVLGYLAYDVYPNGLNEAIESLLDSVNPAVSILSFYSICA